MTSTKTTIRTMHKSIKEKVSAQQHTKAVVVLRLVVIHRLQSAAVHRNQSRTLPTEAELDQRQWLLRLAGCWQSQLVPRFRDELVERQVHPAPDNHAEADPAKLFQNSCRQYNQIHLAGRYSMVGFNMPGHFTHDFMGEMTQPTMS